MRNKKYQAAIAIILAIGTVSFAQTWEYYQDLRQSTDGAVDVSGENARWLISEGNNIIATWADHRNPYTANSSEIYLRRSTNGGFTWENEQRMTTTYLIHRSVMPCVYLYSGKAHLIWAQKKLGYPEGDELSYCVSGSNGAPGTWSAKQTVYQYFGIDNPSMIAIIDTVHVVFSRLEQDGMDNGISYARSTDQGQTWSVMSLTIRESYRDMNPSISVSLGKIHIVYVEQIAGGGHKLKYLRNNANGNPSAWTTPVELANGSSASITSLGNKIFVGYLNSSEDAIFTITSNDGGVTWNAPTLVKAVSGIAITGPSVNFNRTRNNMLAYNIVFSASENGGTLFHDSTLTALSWQPYGIPNINVFASHVSSVSSGKVEHVAYEEEGVYDKVCYVCCDFGSLQQEPIDNSFSMGANIEPSKKNYFGQNIFSTHIKFNNPFINGSSLMVNLYDITGRSVCKRVFDAAFETICISGSDINVLPSGVYIVSISDGKTSVNQKVLKLK